MRLSILIPVYNEEKLVYPLLEKLTKVSFGTIIDSYELVVVNDGSRDNSATEIRRFQSDYPKIQFHYIEQSNQGK
jgi:glycosyltransferase involved in cell wall biosynthesis